MFAFISYWRIAAIVLCDMSSTVFYVGAIVESLIGKAAPWFILAVLLFSFGMRAVYVESCALFVRGGVYRIVKEALGTLPAKAAVSALLFDYMLTGPISSVSAGQYVIGLFLELANRLLGVELEKPTRDAIKNWTSVAIACGITLYFWRLNVRGLHESSGKALRIMMITTVMGILMLAWSGLTIALRGPVNEVPTWQPELSKKTMVDEEGQVVPRPDPVTGEQLDPLGVLGDVPRLADPIRNPGNWLSILGAIGLVIAFGHAILGMSGMETLSQVYREVESPKLPNFKRVGLIVFAYSLLLTGSLNFLAVILIPDGERMTTYHDNWIGGLAMNMIGPEWLLLCLNAFVVLVGFLILSGAVNTSMVGLNGVLSRVAEDGVLPDWFLRPHAKFGTNYRLLYMIVGLQLCTIIASRGDVLILGEAYAFGVIWCFVFNAMSMLVLRFKRRGPRDYVVPLNIRIGDLYFPIGLVIVFLIIFSAALANFVTKPVATVGGLVFGAVFLTVFSVTEYVHRKRRGGREHEHLEQFNRETLQRVTAQSLGLTRPYRKLVAIRSPYNLFMLDKALADTDPETTDVVVMTAKVEARGADLDMEQTLDMYDQHLLTAVVNHAEKLGKTVQPVLVPTNNALHAVLKLAKELPAQEILLGASNKYTAEEQLDQIAFYWINLSEGTPQGLTVHVVSQDRDVTFDLDGGNRIPKISERQARSVADLRAAGIGVQRVLLAHDGTLASHDVFEWLLTMLAADIGLGIVSIASSETLPQNELPTIEQDRQQAEQLGRPVQVLADRPQSGEEIVQLINAGNYDAVVLPSAGMPGATGGAADACIDYLLHHAPCGVFIAFHPAIPRQVVA
ncbi:MAG: amino acid permease [Pirellulales bacterium]